MPGGDWMHASSRSRISLWGVLGEASSIAAPSPESSQMRGFLLARPATVFISGLVNAQFPIDLRVSREGWCPASKSRISPRTGVELRCRTRLSVAGVLACHVRQNVRVYLLNACGDAILTAIIQEELPDNTIAANIVSAEWGRLYFIHNPL